MRLLRSMALIIFLAGAAACSGAEVTNTPRPLSQAQITAPPVSPVALSPSPNCRTPSSAQQVALQFLTYYNAGDVEAIMKLIAPDLRQYIDASSSFTANQETVPDIRKHLQEMAAAHDQLTAKQIEAGVEPSAVLAEYTIRIPDVTRTSDLLKSRPKGQAAGTIEMSVRCDTLLLSLVAIETR